MKKIGYKCWWCGRRGDSGEHKFKRTDLIGEFGTTFSEKENRPMLIKNEKEYEIKSSKSKFVKFEKVLCSVCNNDKSQDFDIDYTTFIEFVLNNYAYYKDKKHIDLKEIFPSNWKEKKRNIYSYFIKHFCSRLARNNINISYEIISFLNKDIDYLENIFFVFQQKADLFTLLNLIKNEGNATGFLEFGKLMFYEVNNQLDFAHTYLTRKWFRVEMYYSKGINCRSYPNLVNYYNNSLINFDTVAIFETEGINELKEIRKLTQNYEYNSKGYIEELFKNDPFLII